MEMYQATSENILKSNKTEQIEKDSGVYDRLSENYSLSRYPCSSSNCPSECLRLPVHPSPNTTTSSAYSSAASSCCENARRKPEAAGRHFLDSNHLSRVPHHPVVTGSALSTGQELSSSGSGKTVATLAVPRVHSRPSRGDSSSSVKSDQVSAEDSRYLYNANSEKIYEKKRLLGKGGFARVYEVVEVCPEGNPLGESSFAAKIINKSRIPRPHQREKVDHEVELLAEARDHPNVVNLLDSFEDETAICILLELCRKKSLAQHLRRKQYLSEPEVCHIMQQIVSGLTHLHSKGIIHRDLKLGNILLTDSMEVKIGDFGLATRLEWGRKKTICGTPNFIAPEVLQRLGHGLEADIWALGCLMYTLLVGKPPFETSSLRETYRCIVKNSYRVPSTVSAEAADLIRSMLRHKPKARPTISEVASHPFFQKHLNYMPSLPKTPVTSIRDMSRKASNAVVLEQQSLTKSGFASSPKVNNLSSAEDKRNHRSFKVLATRVYKKLNKASHPVRAVAAALRESRKAPVSVRVETPAVKETAVKENVSANAARTWVNKWVDYSNRYGFGYQLSDGKISVLFNDGKHISLLPSGKTIEYISGKGAKPISFPVDDVPSSATRYADILQNFTLYMDKSLTASQTSAEQDEKSEAVRLLKWCRTDEYVAMYFSDHTLQVNFTRDHVKVNISSLHHEPAMLVTVLNAQRNFQSFALPDLLSQASLDMKEKLLAIHKQLHSFLDNLDFSSHPLCKICGQY